MKIIRDSVKGDKKRRRIGNAWRTRSHRSRKREWSAASPLSRRLLFYIVLFGLYSVLLALIAWLGFAVDLIPKSYAAVALVSACIGVIVVVGLAYAYVRHSSLTRADDENRGSLPAGKTRAIDTGDIPLPSMRRVVLIAGVGSVAIVVFALVGVPVWLVLAVFVLSILPFAWIEHQKIRKRRESASTHRSCSN